LPPGPTMALPPILIPALSSLLERSGTYVFATDLSGRYTYVNRQVQVLLGAPLEGIVGRCDSDFFGPDLVKRNREHEQRVLRDGIPVSGQERGVVLSDGQSRAFWTVKASLRDGDSRVVGFCGISLDITEHLLLEKQCLNNEYEFRLLAETVPAMVWIAASVDEYIFFNQRWSSYTGRHLNESLANGWALSLHPEDQDRARAAWCLATERLEELLLELRFRRADGVGFFLERIYTSSNSSRRASVRTGKCLS
ncbi:MAG: PAS domain S-box protein, partial [Betaproteobacteria bacterium]|nr:PAS domain S-box protein [Betaproteobacteria bacterium]